MYRVNAKPLKRRNPAIVVAKPAISRANVLTPVMVVEVEVELEEA